MSDQIPVKRLPGPGTATLALGEFAAGEAIPVANGGSGQTTANAALNAFLPGQGGNVNKFLQTDGSNTLWAVPSVGGLSGGHNDLTGLQGGAAGEYYHLTSAQNSLVANATEVNTPSTLVKRDASGNFSAGTITATFTGNASTATKLATARTLAITGDLAWTSPSFDGSGNVTAAGTLATVNANVGSFGSATQVASITVNGKGLVTAASNVTVTPAWGSITSKPTTLSGYGITDAVPSSRTVNGKALSADVTLGLASTDFANQGTTSTVLHGNAAGPPSFGAVVTADLANAAVTYAKMQNVSATDKLLGRSSAGAGSPEEIACTAQARTLLAAADQAGERTAMGLGGAATLNAGVDSLEVPHVDDLASGAFLPWEVQPVCLFPVEQTAAYTVVPSDRGKVLFATHATGFTVTLPAASDCIAGWALPIKAHGAGAITVAATGSDTIDGGASISISAGASKWIVRYSSSAWRSF